MNIQELIDKVNKEGLKVCSDSRKVGAGDVFVAIKGTQFDGHSFIEQAVVNGAEFVVCCGDYTNNNITVIKVPDTSIIYGRLAQAAYTNPSSSLCNLAVTGTNGKTTTGFLVQAIIKAANAKCGLIGTVINDTGSSAADAQMTTPDALDLAAMQRQMLINGCSFMVIEASSHAIEQNRLTGIDFKAAAFTNLTGDHLDYHKTMDNYLSAKGKLFENLSSKGTAVLNIESPQSAKLAKLTSAKVLFYGIDTNSDISAEIISQTALGTTYNLKYQGNRITIQSPLAGRHNVSNHLAAAGLALAAGFTLEQIKTGLESLKVIPGRLESVNLGQSFSVFVDYAHTDDALINVLTTLRALCKGKLTVLFGCGGDRDRTKRPRMAEAGEKYADNIIITSDNPRSEDPNAIIAEILAGFTNSSAVLVEPDREKAISLAIKAAKKDDIILIAGKGHENYQIIGTEKRHFSDVEIAQKYLKELL